MARFEEYEIALTTVFGNLYNLGSNKIGKFRFYHSFGAIFGQTRFFNTQEREYACPVAWGLRQKFKIEKCWILTLTTFSDRLYINRGHPAMGIAILQYGNTQYDSVPPDPVDPLILSMPLEGGTKSHCSGKCHF